MIIFLFTWSHEAGLILFPLDGKERDIVTLFGFANKGCDISFYRVDNLLAIQAGTFL
jgi:hypothetical protein